MKVGTPARWIGTLVAVLAIISIGCVAGSDQAAEAQTASCFPAEISYDSNAAPALTGGIAIGKNPDVIPFSADLGTQPLPNYREYVSDCNEVEIEDEGGTSYAFQFPDNGVSTAHRVQFTAPSECKIARVQKQVVFGTATRKVDCAASLVIVHFNSVYAHAQHQVPTGTCTAEEAESSRCLMLATVVRKNSKVATAKRDTFTIEISAHTEPSGAALLPAGTGKMTFTFAHVKAAPDQACPPGLLPGCKL